MRKYIFLLLFFNLIVLNSNSQNLVGNPGFEINNGTFTGNAECYQSQVDDWAPTISWGMLDKTSVCLSCIQIGSSCHGCVASPDLSRENNPSTGTFNYYTFTGFLEYIVQTFPNPMITDHLYFIQFDGRSPSSTVPSAFGGLHFNVSKPRQCKYNHIHGSGFYEPNITFPALDYSDNQWHTIKNYWVAKDNFKYMTIGDIRENVNETFGLNWDNFKIYDVGSSICPQHNYIQNVIFDGVDGILYKSSVLTESGNNFDPSQPVGVVEVTNTANVTYISEVEVALMPGFNADPGSTFNAFIGPCSDYACPIASAYIGADNEYCSKAGQQVQLGGSVGNGSETYQWTATGSNGINMNSYLNSLSVANPVLTIPSGAGFIKVTENVYNTCSGTTATEEDVIYYDDNPVVNPVISVTPSNIIIGPNNLYPSFTINGDAHTEQVSVLTFDANGNQINEFNIENFNLTTNGTFSYNYNQQDISYLTSDACATFSYKVYSKNICSDNMSSPVTVNVGPPSSVSITLLPNVFTPNGDGINDRFCVGVIGATSYAIQVVNADGGLIYNGSGSVIDNDPCVWNGQCNADCGFTTQNGIVCDGTYYFVLDFYGCNNSHIGVGNFTDLYSYCGSNGKMANSNDTTSPSKPIVLHDTLLKDPGIPKISKGDVTTTAVIFPNPTTGLISLNVNSQHKDKLLLNIYNTQGVKVINNHYETFLGINSFNLDLSGLGQGVYFINIADENGTSIKNDKLILIGK